MKVQQPWIHKIAWATVQGHHKNKKAHEDRIHNHRRERKLLLKEPPKAWKVTVKNSDRSSCKSRCNAKSQQWSWSHQAASCLARIPWLRRNFPTLFQSGSRLQRPSPSSSLDEPTVHRKNCLVQPHENMPAHECPVFPPRRLLLAKNNKLPGTAAGTAAGTGSRQHPAFTNAMAQRVRHEYEHCDVCVNRSDRWQYARWLFSGWQWLTSDSATTSQQSTRWDRQHCQSSSSTISETCP